MFEYWIFPSMYCVAILSYLAGRVVRGKALAEAESRAFNRFMRGYYRSSDATNGTVWDDMA